MKTFQTIPSMNNVENNIEECHSAGLVNIKVQPEFSQQDCTERSSLYNHQVLRQQEEPVEDDDYVDDDPDDEDIDAALADDAEEYEDDAEEYAEDLEEYEEEV